MSATFHDQPEPRDSLVRGNFSDSTTRFTVLASSATAPDSFQVSANGNWADIVLIVSGINTGHLHSTWGDGWRTFNPDGRSGSKTRPSRSSTRSANRTKTITAALGP